MLYLNIRLLPYGRIVVDFEAPATMCADIGVGVPFEGNGPFKVVRIARAHAMNAVDFNRLLVVATRDTIPGHVYRMLWETGRAGVYLEASAVPGNI